MFSVYGIHGRIFNATVDQWRRVAQVSAMDRSAAVRAGGPQGRTQDPGGEAGVAMVQPDEPSEPRREALAAYAQTQKGSGQRHPLSLVRELMSHQLITLAQSMPLAQAWPLLAEQGIGQAPAVDEQGQLVGLMMRADLLHAGLSAAVGQDPAAWQALLSQPVSALMRTPVPSVSPEAEIRHVTLVMLDTGLPGLPVADEHGQVVGFISRSDILRAVVAEPPLELWA